MTRESKDPPPRLDLQAEALAALEAARTMPPGPERNEAMKKAGILQNAADLQGIFFAKRGRPTKKTLSGRARRGDVPRQEGDDA
jgi:hypothetical protein